MALKLRAPLGINKILVLWALCILFISVACTSPTPMALPDTPTYTPTQPPPTPTSTITPSPEPTNTPTFTPSPSATATQTPTPTNSATPTETITTTPTEAPPIPQVIIYGSLVNGYVSISVRLVDVSPRTEFTVTYLYYAKNDTWTATGTSDQAGRVNILTYYPFIKPGQCCPEGPNRTGSYKVTIQGADGFFAEYGIEITK